MTTPAADKSLHAITLAQWLPVLQRWLGLHHVLVVGHSQQALSLLNGDPEAITLFKAGSPAANHAPTPAAHVPSPYAAARTRHWLIAEQSGPATFHQASLPSESGLLPATALTDCWPGIKPMGQHMADALSLDDACTQASAEHAWASSLQCLWIGCLPATALLRGANQVLQQVDVVALRVQLHTGAHPDASLHGAQALLQTHGFTLCGVDPERNPHLGTALFVRDYHAAHSKSLQVRDELARDKAALQAQLAAETQTKQAEAVAKTEAQKQRDELAQAKADLQSKLSAETQAKQAEAAAKAEAQRQRDDLAKAKVELEKVLSAETQAKRVEAAAKADAQIQLDELSKTNADLQAQLAVETQTKQAEAVAKAEAQKQRDDLARAKAELETLLSAETHAKQAEAAAKVEAQKQRDELAQANAALQAHLSAETEVKQAEAAAKDDAQKQRDQLAQANAALQAQLSAETEVKQVEAAEAQKRQTALELENQELAQRQRLLQSEIVKAETQIELIKEMLLREPGL